MPHPVHAPPFSVKHSLADPPRDRLAAETGVQQLRDGDYTVLAGGDPGYPLVR